jgi:GNAT superfamily N-acetyltransferase
MANGDSNYAQEMSLEECQQWVWDAAKLALENMRTIFSVEILSPAGADKVGGVGMPRDFGPAVDELRIFRAEILYAAGRRPYFRAEGGGFGDSEEADAHAYHITCRDRGGALVGCLRLAPGDLLRSSAVEAHLGPEETERLIRELDIDRTQLLEAGRLVVAADRRRQGVAAAILLVALVLARRIGRPVIWGTSGERDGQHRYFARVGSSVLPGSSKYVPIYDDNVCVVVHDQRFLAPLIDQAIEMAECDIFDTNGET